ncbi:hypothetical protein KW844_00735 [Chitinophaga sp. sic0106]|nr:hypothetical protein [Chitinophaga sp. sic0106]
MKYTTFLLAVLLFSCTAAPRISGEYAHYSMPWIELNFNPKDSTFTYINRTKWGIIDYANGNWTQQGRFVLIDAYNHNDIHKVPIVSKLVATPDSDRDSIIIKNSSWPGNDPLINKTLFINDSLQIGISLDTAFSVGVVVNKLFLLFEENREYEAAHPLHIHHLYSDTLNINSPGHKQVHITFDGSACDFFRKQMKDTLIIKDEATLKFGTEELRRTRKK